MLKPILIAVGICATLVFGFLFLDRESNTNIAELTLAEALKDRDTDVSLRDILPERDIIPFCKKNFSDDPCDGYTHLTLTGPRFRLPNGPLRQWDKMPAGDLGKINYHVISNPERCTAIELSRIENWLDELLAQSTVEPPFITPYIEDYYKCQFNNGTMQSPSADKSMFLIVGADRFHGNVRCYRAGYAPNPVCRVNLYDRTGTFRQSHGPITARNIRSFIRELNVISAQFLARHESFIGPKTGGIEFPTKTINWDSAADVLLAEIAREVQ